MKLKILGIASYEKETGEGYMTLSDGKYIVTCYIYYYFPPTHESYLFDHNVDIFDPELIETSRKELYSINQYGEYLNSYEIYGKIITANHPNYIMEIGNINFDFSDYYNKRKVGDFVHIITDDLRIDFTAEYVSKY